MRDARLETLLGEKIEVRVKVREGGKMEEKRRDGGKKRKKGRGRMLRQV